MTEIRSQSMVGPLKSVLMKRPEQSYGSQTEIADRWKDLNYNGPPNLPWASVLGQRSASA